MIKSVKRISIILLIVIICIGFGLSMTVNATSIQAGIDDITNPGNKGYGMDEKIATIGNNIIGVIQVIAVSVAVIMLALMGIKYMSAAPSEKAELKKGFTIYIIGAVLIFASTGIVSIIRAFWQ